MRKRATKGDPVVTTVTTEPEKPEEPKTEKPDVGAIWHDLFTQERTTTCAPEIARAEILAELKRRKMLRENPQLDANGQPVTLNSSDGGFSWIKKWGMGPVSYLFDFFDPVFRKPIVKEMNTMWTDLMKFTPEPTPEYKDPFDYAEQIKNAPPQQQPALLRQIKKLTDANAQVYKDSANAVQLHKAMLEWKWFKDPGASDPAAEFITKYDINHDGRLAPNEFILGAILYNKPHFIDKKCKNCFSEMSKKLKAVFTFLDCAETGYITAEIMWNNLGKLKRNTEKWNIFKTSNSDTIRTAAVNDFILKNEGFKDAAVNQNEFISGVLLGVWERQTTDKGIDEDDGRSLKSLRWDVNNTIDKAAHAYTIAVEEAKAEQIEREMQQKIEAIKRRREEEEERELAMRK